jgi:hypothetical protein
MPNDDPTAGSAEIAATAYAPPVATATAVETPWRTTTLGRFSVRMFGLGLLGLILGLVATLAATSANLPSAGFIGLLAFAALGILGIALSIRSLGSAEKPLGAWAAGPIAARTLLGTVSYAFGGFLVLLFVPFFVRGRQPRRRGRSLLPHVSPGGEWAQLAVPAAADPALRSALAAEWRQTGRTEHASVAAFARLSLDLIAVGAPPKLIADANRDALDEIHHAELCFSLARALDGSAESPGPFPEAQHAGGLPRGRTFALVKLAVDSLIDGALQEGVSARLLARVSRTCEEPATREVVRELLVDEGRHSAHGWRVVEWCLAEGGAPVAQALRGAAHAMPSHASSRLPEPARSGAWQRYGIPGEAMEAEERAKAHAHMVGRVHELTAGVLEPVTAVA